MEEQGLLRQGDRVCVALSGGADSVALLAVLLGLRDTLGLAVRCCHVNHNLRGEESARDEQFVKELCARFDVPLTLFSVDCAGAARRDGLSVETAARNERYGCFARLAQSENCLVATAHTASDQAETVLFRLARGTGLRGLCGIPAKRGPFIRPLLCVTRQQVEAYVGELGLPFVTDSTNLSDVYTRNRLRHQVIPQLKDLNPSFEAAVTRMCAALRQDETVLENLTQTEYERVSSAEFSLAAFASVPEGLLNRVIQEFFCRHGLLFDAKKCILIRSLMAAGSGAVQVGKEQAVTVAQGRLALVRTGAPVFHGEVCTFQAPKTVFLHLAVEKQSLSAIHRKDTFFMVDYDKLVGKPFLRTRRPGDTVKLPGRPTKTVKKLYSEQKTQNRDEKVLVCDALGVVWLEDAGPVERAAVDGTTKTILKMGVVCFDER